MRRDILLKSSVRLGEKKLREERKNLPEEKTKRKQKNKNRNAHLLDPIDRELQREMRGGTSEINCLRIPH